jgi:hypothetical protein
MSDARVIIWFTWFLVWNWLRQYVVLSKERIAKGVHAMKRIVSLTLALFVASALFLGLSKIAAAEDDPPGRVARLNYMQGSVSFQANGEGDWVQADSNRPLTTGDNLWADKDSRGEVHIGATAIRLSSETGISFLNLDDRTAQIQLAQGTVEVHLRHLGAGNAFEIDTPNLAFTITSSGEYRIETDPAGNSTIIIVREGEGEVTGGGESYNLTSGQQYSFSGTDQLNYDAQEVPAFDDFEDWCQARDQHENDAPSARYVSRDVDGYYDLDDYGDWQNVPEYGAIWVPTGVAAGWAPYHNGHWIWISPWGWTWVENEPWGFAPFHYGRWAFVGDRWGWVPGPMVVRPVYAPALVGFVGGGGFGVAVGFGGGFTGVGWFPLGPRDVFIPGYRSSARYVQNVNITNSRVINVTQVTNVYNNYAAKNLRPTNYMYANNTAAVTAVRKEDFVNARPVATAAVRVTPEQIQSAHPEGSAALAPTRASYVSAAAKPASAKPAVPFTQRPVVAKLNPPAPLRNERTPQFSNDSPEFRQRTPSETVATPAPAEAKGAEATPRSNTPTPPAGTKSAGANGANNSIQQHPAVKYSPPVRATEKMYDVHPPLNQKGAQAPKASKSTAQPSHAEPHR